MSFDEHCEYKMVTKQGRMANSNDRTHGCSITHLQCVVHPQINSNTGRYLHIKGPIPRHKEKIMEIDFRPKPYKGELVFSDIEDGQFFVDCDGDLFQKTNESFANMIAAQDGSPEAVGNIHFSPNADVKRIAAVTKIYF